VSPPRHEWATVAARKFVSNMIQNDKLDALCQLLKEMTFTSTPTSAYAPSRRMRRIENWTMGAFIVTSVIFVTIAAWHRYNDGPSTSVQSFSHLLYGLYFLTLILATAYLAIVTVGALRLWWRNRHDRFGAIFMALKNEAHSDAAFLAKLWSFDKATLEYGLLQYRHSWMSFDGRITMLAGNLRKLGLFPALAAASISANTLLKEGSNFFLWAPLILASCFHLTAFYTMGNRERADQVVALLEYAISHARVR